MIRARSAAAVLVLLLLGFLLMILVFSTLPALFPIAARCTGSAIA